MSNNCSTWYLVWLMGSADVLTILPGEVAVARVQEISSLVDKKILFEISHMIILLVGEFEFKFLCACVDPG